MFLFWNELIKLNDEKKLGKYVLLVYDKDLRALCLAYKSTTDNNTSIDSHKCYGECIEHKSLCK